MAAFVAAEAWRGEVSVGDGGTAPVLVRRKRLVLARWDEDPNTSLSAWPTALYDKGHAPGGRPLDESYSKPFHPIIPFVTNTHGREAEVYLHHIITKYDVLDDYTVFLQANPYPHANDFEKELEYEGPFKFIGRAFCRCKGDGSPHHPGLAVADTYRAIFNREPPAEFEFASGAQFIASKELIRSKPRSFWIKCQEVLRNTEQSAHVFERLWANLLNDPL